MPGGGDLPGGPVDPFLTNVTDRGDPAAGNLQEVADMAAALQPNPDHANAHGLDGGRGEDARA